MSFWKLSQLVAIEKQNIEKQREAAAREASSNALFFVAARRRMARWRISSTRSVAREGFRVDARHDAAAKVGDAPDSFHPLYLAAVVAARKMENSLPDSLIPNINFTTDEATRRSMTLNAMRMSTEYFANGSLRVLDLVENRLQIGQSDVVHNALVYLMRRVFDIQAEAEEARDLRAESLAAFLGLNQSQTRVVLSSSRPSARRVMTALEDGAAGTIRRRIAPDDLASVVENQLQILRAELRTSAREEEQVLHLIDEVAMRLRAAA